jgi:phospholipid transport system substrate-binding protein
MGNILAALCLCITLFSPAWASPEADALATVDSLTAKVIKEVVEAKTDMPAKSASLAKLFTEHGDMTTVSRFVLSRYWRLLDKAGQDNFRQVFVTSLSRTWARRFVEFAGGAKTYHFEHKKAEVNPDSHDVFVTSDLIVQGAKQPTQIVWRFKNAKLTDIIVEGVSMAMTYRNEFGSVLSKNGGDVAALTKLLQDGKLTVEAPAVAQ